jgi:hypothetical protein
VWCDAWAFGVAQSLLSWQRVRASNGLARNGRDWTQIFAQYNSGTYNNRTASHTHTHRHKHHHHHRLTSGLHSLRSDVCVCLCVFVLRIEFMVVDGTLFTAGAALPGADVLHIIEQMPGATFAADVTSVLLANGYWASFNRPYFNQTYDLVRAGTLYSPSLNSWLMLCGAACI